MNKMIKVATIVVGAATMFAGCGADAPKENSPKAAAVEGAKTKCAAFGKEVSYEVGLVKMHPDGDKAIVDVKVSGIINGLEKRETLHIDVKNVNGNWVVD